MEQTKKSLIQSSDIELSGSKKVDNGSRKFKNPGIGLRHFISILLGIGVCIIYLKRISMSIVIVSMRQHNEIVNNVTQKQERHQTYLWDNRITNYVLCGFFVGNFIMSLPSAIIGTYLNTKYLLLITCFSNGFISLVMPTVIMYKYNGSNQVLQYIDAICGSGNWKVVMILRTLQGCLQAFALPEMFSIIAQWAPVHERDLLIGLMASGQTFGTALSLAVSGIAGNSCFNWPSIFWFNGVPEILWAFVWLMWGSYNPFEHKSISAAELDYIRGTTNPVQKKQNIENIPWKSILTSLPVWSLIIVHTGNRWAWTLLPTEMPIYLNGVFNLDINSEGLLMALSFLISWMVQFPVAYITHYITKRKFISITLLRKICTSIGMWGGAICTIMLGFGDGKENDSDVTIQLFTIALCLNSFCQLALKTNHVDLTSNYVRIVTGIGNVAASFGGCLASLTVGYIVHDVTSVEEWRLVFYLTAAGFFITNVIFILYGSAKTQPWNNAI